MNLVIYDTAIFWLNLVTSWAFIFCTHVLSSSCFSTVYIQRPERTFHDFLMTIFSEPLLGHGFLGQIYNLHFLSTALLCLLFFWLFRKFNYSEREVQKSFVVTNAMFPLIKLAVQFRIFLCCNFIVLCVKNLLFRTRKRNPGIPISSATFMASVPHNICDLV